MGEEKHIIDDLPDVVLIKEALGFFGVHRVVQLTGWAVLWGAQGVKNDLAFRKRLEAQGVARVTAFRAAADLRRFGVYLETKYQGVVSPVEVVERLRNLNPSDVAMAVS
jgi:hypothetical protein